MIFWLLAVFLACANDEVETLGGISGLVTSLDNGEPLSGGSVSISPADRSATTGSDGRYEFLNLEPGQYTVQIMCRGHKTNTKRITVVAGEVVAGDIQLAMGSEDFALSTNKLQFGSGNIQHTFDIINTSISRSIDWNIPDGYPSWLSVSEIGGTLLPGGQRAITVTLQNTPAYYSEGYITVEVAGSTKQVYVTVAGNQSGGDGDGGGSDSGVSGTVTSCDSRIIANMTTFRMSGFTAVMEYTLRNDGEDIANFDLEKYTCGVYDDLGTGYEVNYQTKVYFEFGSQKAFDGWSRLRQPFPGGTTLKGMVKIMNVPAGAKEFTRISIGFSTYDSSWNLDSNQVIFKNVKIK